jgi:hypothetical protein
MDEVKKYKIFLDKREEGIRSKNGQIGQFNQYDFYVTVSIFKNIEIDDYVNVEIDPLRYQVERQEINPYFIELGFFEDIESVDSRFINDTKSVMNKSKNYNIEINK